MFQHEVAPSLKETSPPNRPYESPTSGDPHLMARSVVVLFLVGAVAAGFLWWWNSSVAVSGIDPTAESRTPAPASALNSQERANIAIYERVSPCVVQVTNLGEQTDGINLDVQQVPQGVGSGFVWDQDGHIVTNYHVVEGASGARVTLSDHATYEARNIWADPDHDVAVLWIKAPKDRLHPIVVGSSHDLKVGQIAYALGDPFGLDETMTAGIVSALGRQIETSNGRQIQGVIQTSAPLNPGNSGGPLLDSGGRLIGMNTAILSPSGAFAGIGFAIPIDEVNHVVPQLIQHGKIVRPRLGVQVAADETAQRLGVEQGVLIVKVMPNSAAAQAGLQGTRRGPSGDIEIGDVVVAVDGKPVANSRDLNEALAQHKVGDSVTLTIVREGKRQDLRVTLGST